MDHGHASGLNADTDVVGLLADALQDAVLDTLYLIPFLLVTYLLMEWLEHKTGSRAQEAVEHAGVFGPAVGALLGAIPQCGFSAAASTLYAGRVVTLGTLFAVYLSTSDEMLPIFIAEHVSVGTIGAILATKIALGMVFGFAIDALLRATHHANQGLHIHELCVRDRCECSQGCATCEHSPELAYGHHDDCADGCDHAHHQHDHSHDRGMKGIVLSAVRHTLQVALFVLAISLVLDVALAVVGEETLEGFFGANPVGAIAASAIFGLVPNCAASVAIAQLYVEGVLGSGAMMAGLLSAAGVGLLVLIRTNRPARENVAILATLAVFSALCGIAIDLIGVVF